LHWQVPDIYDSAKYDAIHNRELGLDLQALYEARGRQPVLAAASQRTAMLLQCCLLVYVCMEEP
jgi:hypothetical protein